MLTRRGILKGLGGLFGAAVPASVAAIKPDAALMPMSVKPGETMDGLTFDCPVRLIVNGRSRVVDCRFMKGAKITFSGYGGEVVGCTVYQPAELGDIFDETCSGAFFIDCHHIEYACRKEPSDPESEQFMDRGIMSTGCANWEIHRSY